jgi:hypothetical protein
MEAVTAWNGVFDITVVPAVAAEEGFRGWSNLRATFREPRYSPKYLERSLSEKGYEQRSKRKFGCYREDEMGRKSPFRWSVEP